MPNEKPKKKQKSEKLLLPEIPLDAYREEEPPLYLRRGMLGTPAPSDPGGSLLGRLNIPLGGWAVRPKRWKYPEGKYYGFEFKRSF